MMWTTISLWSTKKSTPSLLAVLEKEQALEAEKRKVAELKAQIAAGSVGTAGEAHASQQH